MSFAIFSRQRPGQSAWREGRWWVLITVSYMVVWSALNLAALTVPWWYQDDWWMAGQPPASVMALANEAGRPVTAVLLLAQYWGLPPDGVAGNMAIRWSQGFWHCLTAALAALFFSQLVGRRWAAAAGLPFLIWAFNGEAVLWFGGIQHVAGAFFAVAGFLLIVSGCARRLAWLAGLGSIGQALAVLSNQAPANAGLLLWLALVAHRLIEAEKLGPVRPTGWRQRPFAAGGEKLDSLLRGLPIGLTLREAGWLAGGLAGGAAISLWMMIRAGYNRAEAPIELAGKLDFLRQLTVKLFAWPGYYPAVTQAACLTVAGLFGGLAVVLWRGRRLSMATLLWLAMIVPGGLGLLFFANLVIAMNWASYRIFYSAPLLLCVLLVMAWRMAGELKPAWIPRVRALLCVCLALMAGGFGYVSFRHAKDYRRFARREIQTVRNLELAAQRMGRHKVLTMPWPYCAATVNWNPHAVRYPNLDAHRSEFLTEWSGHPFIEFQSTLLQTVDPALRERYRAFAQSFTPGPPYFEFVPAPDDPDLILVIPR